MTPDRLRLRQWLTDLGVTQVAMESTASYWKPVYNVLEGHLEVLVVNAQHVKAVPGRKTDLERRRVDRGAVAAWAAAS
jgi:transposase